MNIKQTHDFIELLLEKSQSGFFDKETIDLCLDRAQMGALATYYAQFMETGYVHDALNPFRVKMSFAAANFLAGGILQTPNDYLYPTGLYGTTSSGGAVVGYKDSIKLYKEDELGDALTSQVRQVTSGSPIAYPYGVKAIAFYPIGTCEGVLHYLRRPAVPKFNYDIVGRQKVYKAIGSTDMEWGDAYMNIVIMKAIELLGVNVNDAEIVRFAGAKATSNLGGDKI